MLEYYKKAHADNNSYSYYAKYETQKNKNLKFRYLLQFCQHVFVYIKQQKSRAGSRSPTPVGASRPRLYVLTVDEK